MELITLYVTYPSEKEAERIVQHLLKKKLIACANIFPIRSLYTWKGKLEDTQEVASLLKTRKENGPLVKKEIEKMHPYEVPCIEKFSTEANAAYASWVLSECPR